MDMKNFQLSHGLGVTKGEQNYVLSEKLTTTTTTAVAEAVAEAVVEAEEEVAG
jgi:hypothetical protein